MKLYAIVDKSGECLINSCASNEFKSKQNFFDSYVKEFISHFDIDKRFLDYEKAGYRCIELHTYDPEKQVVVDKQVFDFLHGGGELEGCSFGERHPVHKGAFWWRKFLKAGEMKHD